MDIPLWAVAAEALQNVATALAVIVGAVWAYYRFGMTRESETALAIDLRPTTIAYGDAWLTSFNVILENRGRVRVGAKRQRHPAYRDANETLLYPVDLLLRRVPVGARSGSHIGWFQGNDDRSPREGDIEIDLAADYEMNGETDFWLEPGETYHLTTGMILPAGTYLAMVTFVGDRSDQEFWRRVFFIEILSPTRQRLRRTPATRQEQPIDHNNRADVTMETLRLNYG